MARLPAVAQLSVGTAALAVAPGVAGVLAARSLGTTGRGELAVALALGTIAGTIGLHGFDTALLSVKRESANNRFIRSLIARRSATVLVAEGLAAAVIACLVLGEFRPALAVSVGVMGALTSFFLLARAANISEERVGVVMWADLSSAVTLLAVAIVVTVRDGSPEAYVAAAILGLAVGAAVGWPRARGDHGSSVELEHRLRATSRPAWLARALQAAAFRLDRVVLAALAGSGAAGIYAAAVPFAEMTTIVPLHVAQLVNVRLARAEGDLRWSELRESKLSLSAAALFALVVILVADPLIDVVYGDAFADSVGALRVLAVASVISVGWRLVEAELYARGASRAAAVATGVAAALVVGGTAALYGLGALGAAVASIIGYAGGMIVSVVFVERARRE